MHILSQKGRDTMQNDLEPLIEKYRHELMEYSRSNPRFGESEPEAVEAVESVVEEDEPVVGRILPGGKRNRPRQPDAQWALCR